MSLPRRSHPLSAVPACQRAQGATALWGCCAIRYVCGERGGIRLGIRSSIPSGEISIDSQSGHTMIRSGHDQNESSGKISMISSDGKNSGNIWWISRTSPKTLENDHIS